MTKKESKENQMKSDEISDETIMKVLNAIGYEEKSWITFVREQITYEKSNNIYTTCHYLHYSSYTEHQTNVVLNVQRKF